MLIFFCLAVLGPDCLARAVSSCDEWGLLSVAVQGLLTEGASVVAEQRFQELWHMGSIVVVQGSVALWHVESSQSRDWTSVPCIGRKILIHCTTMEVLVPYFHLQFLLWIKILTSTYYTFLLALTSRNWNRRGNEGNRIKPHFCWAGSLPCPLPAHPTPPQPTPTASLNQIQHQRGVLEWWGLGQVSRRGNLTYTQVERNHFMNTLPGCHLQTQKWSYQWYWEWTKTQIKRQVTSVINWVSKFTFPSNVLESQ